jgi:hypothetical protein
VRAIAQMVAETGKLARVGPLKSSAATHATLRNMQDICIFYSTDSGPRNSRLLFQIEGEGFAPDSESDECDVILIHGDFDFGFFDAGGQSIAGSKLMANAFSNNLNRIAPGKIAPRCLEAARR